MSLCKLQILGRAWRSEQQTSFRRIVAFRFYSSKQKLAYFHCIGKDELIHGTLGQQLAISAEKYPNHEAIVSYHEGKRYSYKNLLDVVDRLAAGFLKLGLKRGDPVAIWSPNNINWCVTALGIARAGLVSVAISPAYQAPELKYCLQKVGVKAIFAPESFKTQNYHDIIQSICPEIKDAQGGVIRSQQLPDLQTVIIDTKHNMAGTVKFDDVLDLANNDDIQEIHNRQLSIMADSPSNIQFTSGTTGHPKAAVINHFCVVNNGFNIGKRMKISNKRVCVQVPLFHGFGLVISMATSLIHHATIVLPSAGFDPEQSLRSIVDERCHVIHGTPTMYVDLIKKQKELNLPIETAEIAVTGGAPCSPQLFKDIKNQLRLKKVKTIYGLTEITAVAFQSLHDDDEDKILNTVGHLQDHLEAKVVDENGETVPFGQPGELCIRGYSVMLNYFGDDLKTKEVISPCRWFRTGDQFVLYENGYGQIVGRLKDMIIRGGENLFPKEIEDFLNTHPDIIESHVIGVEDERMGEEVCAYIRLHDGVKNLSQEDIKLYSKGKIAHFKVPRYVRIINDFPKTVSGKIQKFKLKDMFKKEQERQTRT